MKGPFKNATKLENELHAVSSEGRTAWIQKKLENYQEMSLLVKMRKGTGAPFQVPKHKRLRTASAQSSSAGRIEAEVQEEAPATGEVQ